MNSKILKLLLLLSYSSTQGQICNTPEPPKVVTELTLYPKYVPITKNGRDDISIIDDGVRYTSVGQSFVSTAPYISTLSIEILSHTEPLDLTATIYIYGDDQNPKGNRPSLATLKLLVTKDQKICNFDFTNSVTKSVYLKVGSKYYVDFVSDKSFGVNLSRGYFYGNGFLFTDSIKKEQYDLNMEIKGGYPTNGRELIVYNHNLGGNLAQYTRSYDFNTSVGQTFIATTPYIKSVTIKTKTQDVNIIQGTVYECDVSGKPTFNKLGTSCYAIRNSNIFIFDWENFSPLLKVGRSYFIEFKTSEAGKETSKPLGNILCYSDDVYSGGNCFLDREVFKNIFNKYPDLNMDIKGIDYNVQEEIIYKVWERNSANLWCTPDNTTKAGQVVLATTNYISSISMNVCNGISNGAVNGEKISVSIYEYKNSTDPKGKLITDTDGILIPKIVYCDETILRPSTPIKVDFGKWYYIEISILNGKTLKTCGSKNRNYSTYSEGSTFFYTNGAYRISTDGGPLNLKLMGISCGSPYLGYSNGVNQWFGIQPTDIYKEYICANLNITNQLSGGWYRQDFYVEDLDSKISPNNDLRSLDYFLETIQKQGYGGLIGVLLPGKISKGATKYNSNPSWDWNNTVDFHEEVNLFAAYAKEVVYRYRGYPIIWEFLNEPSFQYISDDRYAYLVKIVSDKIREADPNALIGAGSISGFYDAISDRTIRFGIGNYIDIYTYHPYDLDFPESTLERWTKSRRFNFTKSSTTNRKPFLFASEAGYGNLSNPKLNLIYDKWNNGTSVTSSSAGQYFEYKPIDNTLPARFNQPQIIKIKCEAINGTKINMKLYDCLNGFLTNFSSKEQIGTEYTAEVKDNLVEFSLDHFDASPCVSCLNKFYIEFYTKPNGTTNLNVNFFTIPTNIAGGYYNLSHVNDSQKNLVMEVKSAYVDKAYNTSPYTYYVDRHANASWQGDAVCWGQTFQTLSSAIRKVEVETGDIKDKLFEMNIYNWGNETNPKGTFIDNSTLEFDGRNKTGNFSVFEYKTTEKSLPPVLQKFGKYYIEFKCTNCNNKTHMFGSKSNTYNHYENTWGRGLINDSILYQSDIFNGKTYVDLGAGPQDFKVDNFDVDLNMKIYKAASFTDGMTGTLGREPAIYSARYLLSQMQNGVIGTCTYKHFAVTNSKGEPDHWGLMQWEWWPFPEKDFPKKINGYNALFNIYEYFKNASTSPEFDVQITGDLNIVSREDVINNRLIIAVWKPLSGAFDYSLYTLNKGNREKLSILSTKYNDAKISIIKNIINEQTAELKPYPEVPDGWSDWTYTDIPRLEITNLEVSEQPIIIVLQKR